ncbi:hypothetical protein [Arhodomonas sp. AD133]|uniref:hypothetical protein n=1 Tax=Arhodomonas sp. AD133 TaxID=3415009 RepID=UPI003EB745E7
MRALAAFVMRGRLAAMAVAGVAAMIPLLLWVSGAVIALVTLRRGAAEGLLVTAGATATLGLASQASVGTPVPALQAPIQVWLPVMAVAICLRVTVSLPRALELAAGMAGLGVVAFHVAVGDAVAYWREVLEQGAKLFADPATGETLQIPVGDIAPLLTGLWFGNLLLLGVASLLLGRWWQALLYNPGGFRAEFHGLHFTRGFALVALGLLAVAAFSGPGIINDVALVVSTVFVLQALAVAHSVAGRRGVSAAWLVPVYVLLPPLARIYALVGMLDVFVDLRGRLAGPAGRA